MLRRIRILAIHFYLTIIVGCGSAVPGIKSQNQSNLQFAPGGWTGGGGLIMKDSFNPWWVKNTKDVSVCVEIDEENFGISADRAEEITRGSIDWWKRAFASVIDPDNENKAGVGLQAFSISRVCTSDTDLRMQFGVLHADQREQWKQYIAETPQAYGGIAIRTQYDRVNMHGRGFIYLSPQSGPLKLELDANQTARPWSVGNGKIAALFLMHELGHVFGYRHGAVAGLMDPGMLSQELQSNAAAKWLELQEPYQLLASPFELSPWKAERCFQADDYKTGREFFDLPSGELCVSWEWKRGEFIVKQKKSKIDGWISHASTILSDVSWESKPLDATQIYLPKENQVFTSTKPTGSDEHLSIPVELANFTQKGTLINADNMASKRQFVIVRRNTDSYGIEIIAKMNGKKVASSELLPSIYEGE
jgi:hypothetical protein